MWNIFSRLVYGTVEGKVEAEEEEGKRGILTAEQHILVYIIYT